MFRTTPTLQIKKTVHRVPGAAAIPNDSPPARVTIFAPDLRTCRLEGIDRAETEQHSRLVGLFRLKIRVH